MSHKADETFVVANVPTSAQKAALAGTDGAPSGTNKYVTDSDARNSDARAPTAHASSHQNGGGDEVATATAGANAIPKAGAGATLAAAWSPLTVRGHPIEWQKDADDGSAVTATVERPIHRANGASTVVAIHYTPDANVVAHDTDKANLIVSRRDGAGGAADAVATYTTNTTQGGMTAFIPKTLGAITNGTLAANNILTFQITKDAGGVTIPKGTLTVIVRAD